VTGVAARALQSRKWKLIGVSNGAAVAIPSRGQRDRRRSATIAVVVYTVNSSQRLLLLKELCKARYATAS